MADTHIKINAVTPRVQYTGNGSTTSFPYSFAIFDDSDMVVYVDDDIITTGYTVTGAGQTEGGNVVFSTAPAVGKKITLLRDVPIERITDFQEGGTFRPKNINDELDRQTAFVQQVQETLDRAVKVGPTSDITPETVLAQVERVYTSIDNVDAVADNETNINTVASNISKVQTTANNINNVNTVASNISKVNTVASISSNVTAVAGNATNINAVAGNAANINAVNANKTNINAVAGNSSNINTVATNMSNVNTCASNITAIRNAPTYAANAAASAELSAQYANDKINQTHISNCITEIPQNIKLELSSGTLTLKSGSKVYIPNGTDVFNTFTLQSDITASSWGGGSDDIMLFINQSGSGSFTGISEARCYSGTSQPTVTGGTDAFWYDTANNTIKQTTDSGSTWTAVNFSLPICTFTRSSGTITGIKQVFNGFGYIGSTVFALPGVKGLIPNGRNSDGTLKNNTFSITAVQTQTGSGNNTFSIRVANNYLVFGVFTYDEETNYNYNNTVAPGNERLQTNAGEVIFTGGKVTSFNPKPAFHSADYYDAVHRTGDEMIGGTKTFTSDVNLDNSGTGGGFTEKDTGLANNSTTPAADRERFYREVANDGSLLGNVNFRQTTSGRYYAGLLVRRNVSGTNRSAEIGVVVDDSGTMYAFAPTPSSDTENSTKIATTAWVNNAKGMISGWSEPDYSSGSSLSNNTSYPVPKDGFIIASGYSNSSSDSTVTLNGATFLKAPHLGGQSGASATFCFPVRKNDSVTINFTGGGYGLTFYPLKGA